MSSNQRLPDASGKPACPVADWLAVCNDPTIVAVAKALASRFDGIEVGARLEPGNTPFPDGTEIIDGTIRGGPAFFRWRQFIAQANELTAIVRSETANVPDEPQARIKSST